MGSTPEQIIHLRDVHSGEAIALGREESSLRVKKNERTALNHIPYRQVLSTYFSQESNTLELNYLYRRKKAEPFALVKLEGRPLDMNNDAAALWATALMTHLYEGSGIVRQRRLMVLVNPHGGVGRASSVFEKAVKPIFRAARCPLNVMHTTHHGHAYEIAKNLPLEYDAIVTVSGDGLIHEVLNGFANHESSQQAFAIPIAPIPAGSGNGLSLNLLGLEHGFDVTEAALNVIKGKLMKVDVFSFMQNNKRTISFMSQALGLMADLDIGTENLRWMGDARFMVGLLRGLIRFKACPVQLSYKLAETDKLKMATNLQARRQSSGDMKTLENAGNEVPQSENHPAGADGWITYDKPILYIYAGKGPYVGRDYMAFPVSLPDDGLIDVMAQPLSSRKEILAGIGGAAKGENYWHPNVHYVKAVAYRIKPLASKGVLSVDGESFPFEEYQVEVHQKLAAFLSPHGYYAADFQPKPM